MPGAGTLGLFDGVDLTALSESSPRNRAITTLQIHHATMTSLSGLISMMQPGGRTVSANGAMSNTGQLIEVVPTLPRRAFTSASAYDNQCLTVEACNVTLGPQWQISEATRLRFAVLAVMMFRAGLLRGLWRGDGGILGHSEVPGTYATACPGPDMYIDRIVWLAQQIQAGNINPGIPSAPSTPAKRKEFAVGDRMFYARVDNGQDSGEWMIGGVDLFDDPENVPAESGYYTRPGYWVTEDIDVAIRWGRQWSFFPPDTLACRLERADYIEQQAMLRDAHEQWVKGMRELVGGASS